MNKKNNRDLLLNGNLLKAIMTLAIPVVINSFLQTMYNLTDTYWLGKLGTEELAAINLITPMQNIVINFGSGITVAGSVLISQYLGAKRDEDARSMANQIFACALIFSVVCAGFCAVATPAIVTWLGAEADTWSYSKTYLQLVILDMPFLYTVNIYTAINQAQGDTVRPMFLNLFGISLNMILDPLFMMILKMGVAGAALATVGAKAVPAVIAFILLLNKDKDIHLNLRKLKFEKEKLKSILVIGLPTAIGGSTMQFGFLLMSRNVLKYGTQAMAAYGIGNKINSLITLPTNGIGSAVATIVGQNVGAMQHERAEKGYQISMRISVVFLFIGGMILSRMPISTAIVKIFSQDAEVVGMAADFLSIMAFWCFANGVYNSSMGLFQGSGHTEVTMLIDAARLWVFRFATLYVCEAWLHMGVRSVWYSVVVSNGLSAIVLYIVYRTGYWRKKRIQTG
ncbi:MAG: MATE family efflux transporter [Bacillus sp. (in: Bacteria)]|nr:MATE family efflux transporter [Bacillus sp. (in: firmicutes)]MCM1426304.1 MATE family efflux transporter [Eubacterium sp.]